MSDDVARVRQEPDPIKRGRMATELLDAYQRRVTELTQIRREAVEEARDTLGSYTEVARALGLSKGRITQIRNSRSPKQPEP